MEENKRESLFEVIKREFIKDRISMAALIVFTTIVVFLFIATMFMDQEKIMTVNIFKIYQAPNSEYWLGTGPGGRSILGQLIIGARNSLMIAVCITILTTLIGTTVGIIAGYYGGLIDNIVMRIIDFLVIMPTLLFIIIFVTIIPKYNLFYFIFILTAFSWMGTTRLVRTKALSESNKEYIMASKAMGTSDIKIMIRELLPNISSIIIVNTTLALAGNIGVETGLSFLGYGLPLSTPSLGTLINYATRPEIISNKPWIWGPGVLLILVLILSINYIGQTIKRIVDSKQRIG